ncbi:RNA-directed DNA polymerase, eukaryota, Nucleotide-binding alpha-beta plait domain protein [Artemisia annua]|uniref:RNA-directed DNA polymerase, eukaryota, Nucleotide-binding alpha-beta plait domain protein n=1 Tax=Artemisia annua TaxID=35608 RepID=A0A2U1MA59_ARTAN|nr:RNA-directed DNA polymerase, eukaryota, Nucleotide-binding alpha-beta plait domain protein [Artemisia annua]
MAFLAASRLGHLVFLVVRIKAHVDHKSSTSSKLKSRFLGLKIRCKHKEVLDGVLNCYGGTVLEKGVPDHRPILLKESVFDYGPTPFRFFHSWLDIEGFHEMVVDTWEKYESNECNGMISFKKKLQNLKQVIRAWNASKTLSDNKLKKEHQACLSRIDVKMDQGTATREDLNSRIASMKILGDIEGKEASDLAQKANIKWAIEGDENSSFFHGSLKKKRRQIAIKGVFKNGDWIEEPGEVKAEFYDHFCNSFC